MKEGADCKWRAAFSVTGNMTVIISNLSKFLNSSNSQSAVATGLANVSVVPKEYADADLFTAARRLTAQVIPGTNPGNGELTVTYAVAINAHAPSSVETTGEEVGNKLQPTNKANIEAALSSSVAESMGAGAFDLSVQSVSAPNVVVAEPPALSDARGMHQNLAIPVVFLFALTRLPTSFLP